MSSHMSIYIFAKRVKHSPRKKIYPVKESLILGVNKSNIEVQVNYIVGLTASGDCIPKGKYLIRDSMRDR